MHSKCQAARIVFFAKLHDVDIDGGSILRNTLQRLRQAERLRDVRAAAGFSNPTDAAAHFNWPLPTYYAHENGSRGLTSATAKKYAKAFRTNAAWLLYGEGSPTDTTTSAPPLDEGALIAAFGSLLVALIPEMDAKQAQALVVSALGLAQLHQTRKGTKESLDNLRTAVHNAAELAWPPESE